MAQEGVPPGTVTCVPSLRRDHDDVTQSRHALAALHVAGVDVDWAAVDGPGRRVVDLPTYPFERKPYWAGQDRRVGGV